jgi:hypothetical protein
MLVPAAKLGSCFDMVRVADDRHITVEGQSADEANANARLIAAAPELLRVLESVLAYAWIPTRGSEHDRAALLRGEAHALLVRIDGDA